MTEQKEAAAETQVPEKPLSDADKSRKAKAREKRLRRIERNKRIAERGGYGR